ncbi:ABC transporter permease [Sporolactobacillus sp. Y61]|uniref:ABC transporter permease n=1 Tax=Sporolactobacillus sp. Y61 TaxID=3160863 RepID=A0AAU8IBK4_9BACL|nr:ABC transporter permease [Sporolactobacillus sp. THM19-2]RYL91470.1 ABC transporter permease [Sporolactobacillus sp. THM19-2]
MFRYIMKRILYMFISFYVVLTLTFLSMKMMPGTPFKFANRLSPEQLGQLKHYYGLDQPVAVQYVHYLWNFIHGDLGGSFQYGMQPVTEFLIQRFPVSFQLGLEAMVVGTILGILFGIIAGLYRARFLDWGTMTLSMIGISIPSFIFAAILQYGLSVFVQWFPVAGWDTPMSHVLPVTSLAIGVVALIAQFMRNEMVEVLNQDYIVTAEAKGLTTSAIIFKHAIRNALIPVVTVIGPMTAAIVTGSLVIENIFTIPGIGSQFVEAIVTNDYPMIMGTTELFAALFIVAILVVDILYGIIDPRIRISGGQSS